MIKLAITTAGVIVGGVLLVTSINNLLVVDDLKDCTSPDLLLDKCAPADVIVAISGGDTNARVDEAVRLYKDGWASLLLFSGAAMDSSGPSNAEAMRARALNAGVAGENIIIEPSSLDTLHNAINSRSKLADVKRLIVVTSPYHQRRAGLEFQKIFADATVVNHPTPNDRAWGDSWWLTIQGWWLAITESIKTLVVLGR